MSVLELAMKEEKWWEFLAYKEEKQQISHTEKKKIQDFIERKGYLVIGRQWEEKRYPATLPVKKTVNKEGTTKKRTVYTYEGDEGIFMKFIAFQLYCFDEVFCRNCYAFRRGISAGNAIRRLREEKIEGSYCLKVDISNYFNSIDEGRLLDKLAFVKEKDGSLYELFEKILSDNRAYAKKELITEKQGAMAGTPLSPFFANVYLKDMDAFFEKEGMLYFRYSDDILLFAKDELQLQERKEVLYRIIAEEGLIINQDKERVYMPGEKIDFLGFSIKSGEVDLSESTLRKTKARIKRKAQALKRWQIKKGLSGEKAAIGLIRTMNRKFYGKGASGEDTDNEFSWKRWFFPHLTSDAGLREIDAYMQQYIRFAVTGRHYKGNYRIRYEQMKEWGYKSLVHEFYEWKERDKSGSGEFCIGDNE